MRTNQTNKLIENWKKNIQVLKWNNSYHSKKEYTNFFIENRIKTLTSFFDENDLIIRENSQEKNPTKIWLPFLLQQKNLGSIHLIYQICGLIEYFIDYNPKYLKSKLLKKNGRIDKSSFRNSLFELWINHYLLKNNINVNLDKCYRNDLNKLDEGFDSFFYFNDKSYIVECLKLKAWNEEVKDFTFELIRTLYKRLEKRSNNLFFGNYNIYLIFDKISNTSQKEFDRILNNFLLNKETIISNSESFSSIAILLENSSEENTFREKYKNQNNIIHFNIKFKNISIVDKFKNETFDPTKFINQKTNYNIKINFKIERVEKNFEQLLVNKIKRKIDQHKRNEYDKLIIAIELENFNGMNSFRFNKFEEYPKLKKSLKKDVLIMIVFKDTNGDSLISKIKFIYMDYNSLINRLTKNNS